MQFELEFTKTIHMFANIEADSVEEAREKAKQISIHDIDSKRTGDWELESIVNKKDSTITYFWDKASKLEG